MRSDPFNARADSGFHRGRSATGAARRRSSQSKELGARPFVVRPMEERDLGQAAEVEKDAFPTLFPTTSFRRELRNRIARYLVLARSGEGAGDDVGLPPLPEVRHPHPRIKHGAGSNPLPQGRGGRMLERLVTGARQVWRGRNPSWQPGDDLIVGFVGLWYMVDEAHIVSIGVRSEYRGLGLGELLLISAIEQAVEMGSRVVTLEVRVSNYVAQNLYKKYGFTERGVRKGYYSDNREDALIMTTGPIGSDAYRGELEELVASYEKRWGLSPRHVN